jgi:hypothetical protein
VALQKILDRLVFFIIITEKIDNNANKKPPTVNRTKARNISPRAVKNPITAPSNALQKAVKTKGGLGGIYLNSDI